MKALAPRMLDVMAGWREEEREYHTELGLEYRMLYERYKDKQEGTTLMPWFTPLELYPCPKAAAITIIQNPDL